jgi:hypothetical protein
VNWEAIAAIGELAGAVGVIATLIYVGLQVRQNTSAIKAASIQDISASTTAYLNTWTLAYMSMLRVYESRYLQTQLGVLDESVLESMAGSSELFERPWFKAVWNEVFAPRVGGEFASFFSHRFGLA